MTISNKSLLLEINPAREGGKGPEGGKKKKEYLIMVFKNMQGYFYKGWQTLDFFPLKVGDEKRT